jgi:hypothetical protein
MFDYDYAFISNGTGKDNHSIASSQNLVTTSSNQINSAGAW